MGEGGLLCGGVGNGFALMNVVSFRWCCLTSLCRANGVLSAFLRVIAGLNQAIFTLSHCFHSFVLEYSQLHSAFFRNVHAIKCLKVVSSVEESC